MSTFELFWLEAPTSSTREVDPLGFAAIHETASNRVLPFLTERTRSADEYLLTLVGLRWASSFGGSERDTWRCFERFEKGLKLAWGYLHGWTSGFRGVKAINAMMSDGRVDLDFELIARQRDQGLLGMYLSSLRAMKLVEQSRLALTTPGATLIEDTRFSWDGEAGSSKKWLQRFAALAATPRQKQRLGLRLFGADGMVSVARTIKKLGREPKWKAASRELTGDARAVASHAQAYVRLATSALRDFAELLHTPTKQPIATATHSFSAQWKAAIFGDGLRHLAEPFSVFLCAPARERAQALIDLHQQVWKQREHQTPWVQLHDGRVVVRRDVKWKEISISGAWDHRWAVCHDLIRQTRWSGR